ncbi:HAD-IIIA family hydrolase [Quadrisphaera sp. INWT6]|uniref:HAD-IIIA family hydrolase n=1 Tax=Quadrisphaera sp. INWT6 TaxID=2596917 RepID=UPI0019D6376D|nr:HAD-IIIA family hydrolase [Quadrisphaera sp. INWT6]
MSAGGGPLRWAVVVPTVGRPSLQRLLDTLAAQTGPDPVAVVVADDRRPGRGPQDDADRLPAPLVLTGGGACPDPVVVRSGGRGPAAARNAGWRALRALAAPADGGGTATHVDWVAFVDDDVELPPTWSSELAADLAAAGDRTGGVQGRLRVPLPAHRRPTDWERGTAGLAGAAWATADMAYRAEALDAVGGFDERFPRAYREDADIALRVQRAGWALERGARTAVHPVRPADDWVSLRVQRGNADDALMGALHGPRWREEAQAPPGRLRWHLATTAAAALAVAGLPRALRGRRGAGVLSAAGALAWAGLTADFARRRTAPGPRDAAEVRRMVLTSAAIPLAAVWHRARGTWRWRTGAQPWPGPAGGPLRAVLFDRDGTLVHDVPYNGDPAQVRLVDGAAGALARVRAAGLATGVVTNQSGIARGIITRAQADATTAEAVRQVGGVDVVQSCPHAPGDGCPCRKPAPGMVLAAAVRLGLAPRQVAVVGDIGADVGAARAAGARGVLVPTATTRPEEVEAARAAGDLAPDLSGALDLLLGSRS